MTADRPAPSTAAPARPTSKPRTHLADFLRERLSLTGTHLGCEQGVCGACTVLVDGAPVRSCITFAVACDGRTVRTIEGFDDDAVMAALRAAFSAEHALQCGYCTPGMLVTARDIVLRLPDADEARVRLELAGNLCRCTGYVGIVRAIRRVLDAQAAQRAPSAAPMQLEQRFELAQPPATAWPAFNDLALLVECLPGASLTGPASDGDRAAALRRQARARSPPASSATRRRASTTPRRTGRFEGSADRPKDRLARQGQRRLALSPKAKAARWSRSASTTPSRAAWRSSAAPASFASSPAR